MTLLKLIAAAPSRAAPLAALRRAAGTSARLLVVFLRGGYDAANLLVPVSSSFYYEARPNIAMPQPGAAPNAAIALDADWALHPALRDSLLPLYQKGELAFVPFAGTARSLAQPLRDAGHDRARPGARRRAQLPVGLSQPAATVLSARPRAIAFTDQLPLVFRGELQIPNMALQAAARSRPSTHARPR